MFRRVLGLLAGLGLSVSHAAADPDTVKVFHKAVHVGDVNKTRAMLASDSSLATSVDEFRFQPIHLLDMYFEPEILELLLANGADVNARNDKGVTLLHIITEPDAIPLLVKKGADLEARDSGGRTPLIAHAGEQANGPDVVEALLAAGADPNARGASGETALSIARGGPDVEFERLLVGAGARN